MYGIGNVNCGLRSFITMIIVPLIASNVILRLMIFFFLSELSREMTQLQEADMPVLKDQNACQRVVRGIYDLFFAMYALVFPTRTQMERARVVSALTFVASTKGTVVVFLFVLLPFLAVALGLILTDPTYLRCNGCKLAFAEVVEIIVVAVICILFGIFAAFRVRKYPDPWHMRREATLMCLWGIVILVGFCLGTFFDPAPDVAYDHQLIIVTGLLGFAGVQTVYQVAMAYFTERSTILARKEVRAKREAKKQKRKVKSVVDESQVNSTTTQMTSPNSERLVLKKVMTNPTLAGLFEQFLVGELGVESLLFLRDTDAWKKAYYDVAPSARLARARRLFNTYISTNGSFPVNIPSETMGVIRSQLMKDEMQDCREDIFDAARDEINDLLQVGAVLRFQHSKLYRNYLGDQEGAVKGREMQSVEM